MVRRSRMPPRLRTQRRLARLTRAQRPVSLVSRSPYAWLSPQFPSPHARRDRAHPCALRVARLVGAPTRPAEHGCANAAAGQPVVRPDIRAWDPLHGDCRRAAPLPASSGQTHHGGAGRHISCSLQTLSSAGPRRAAAAAAFSFSLRTLSRRRSSKIWRGRAARSILALRQWCPWEDR